MPDTTRFTEGLFALSCVSRAEVDDLVNRAIAAGGKHAMDLQDHGFMYGRSSYDLDGHHWSSGWIPRLRRSLRNGGGSPLAVA